VKIFHSSPLELALATSCSRSDNAADANRPKQRTDLSVVAVGLSSRPRHLSPADACAGRDMSWGDRRESATRRLRTRHTGPKERAARVERTTALSSVNAPERAASFGNLGAPAKASPRFPRCPARNHLKGAPSKSRAVKSPVTTCMASPARTCRSLGTRRSSGSRHSRAVFRAPHSAHCNWALRLYQNASQEHDSVKTGRCRLLIRTNVGSQLHEETRLLPHEFAYWRGRSSAGESALSRLPRPPQICAP